MSSRYSSCSFPPHSCNPIKSILFNIPFDSQFPIFLFMGSFASVSHSVGFDANGDGIMLAGVISHCSLLWEDYLLCTVISEADIYLTFPWSYYPCDLAVAMCSKYPTTGLTTTLKYFECVVKFTIPFTTIVSNSEILTSLIVQILPFTHSKSCSVTSRPFIVFFFETMVPRCTYFPVFPAFCNSFSVIVVQSWSMTWVPICTRTLFLYI